MKLDSRLMAIADLVRKDKIFADIGTDHAYLPVYLVEKGVIKKAIAADLRVGPLENAKEAVVSYGYSDQIELRLSDGLDNFIENEVEEIAVAGMGGLLIASFIERTQWLKNEDIHLILQPMTHIEELRKTLFDNGFIIDNEVVAEDGYWTQLLEGLLSYYQGTVFTAKLPPEIDIILENAERKQKGVMGLCNISLLLKQLDLNIPYTFSLKDPVVPENNGLFSFQGERSDKKPVFEIEAGILLQVLVGYFALSECKDRITVFDETKFNEIDCKLPKQKCYIIDEY